MSISSGGWVVIAGAFGAAVGAISTNWQKTHQNRKETVAAATKSALRRVEMYYRIRRRTGGKGDDVSLRDLFHEIQEDNDYYTALLEIQSPWLGDSYRQLIKALRAELRPFMDKALKDRKLGPLGAMGDEPRPNINDLVKSFTRDSRWFFNPLLRPWMRAKYWLQRYIRDDSYGL